MRSGLRWTLAVTLLTSLGATCFGTRVLHRRMVDPLTLEPAEVREDSLNCLLRDCQRWYRMHVSRAGKFTVNVAANDPRHEPRISVELRDEREGSLLIRRSGSEKSHVRFGRKVRPGTYLVGVIANTWSPTFTFRVTLDLVAPRHVSTRPPPRPTIKVETSLVLETEGGYGQDAVAVLIELGSRHGMKPGLHGKLFDGKSEIGRVVIEQVYPDGSRARIQGMLSAPITSETVVKIDVPLDLDR